jgi:DNA-binding transcriptional LysR family regulator
MDKSNITLDRMRTFVRVAERGNLSAVARELETGQSTVTRHLRELEDAIGAPLLIRTTRRVTLSDEGRRYYAHCLQILRLVEQASEEIQNTRGTPSGSIRISCTVALGVLHIMRLIFAFQALYPDIRIDFSLTDERIDLVKDGVDIALRLGPLTDSSMKLRYLGESERVLVAAPSYLAMHGKPDMPEHIAAHNVVRMINVADSERLTIKGLDGKGYAVPVRGDLRVDHGLAAREAFRAGRGIGLAHRWLVDDLLANGELEVLLSSYIFPTTPLNMLIVPERAHISRVRLLIDYLVERTGSIPGIGRP